MSSQLPSPRFKSMRYMPKVLSQELCKSFFTRIKDVTLGLRQLSGRTPATGSSQKGVMVGAQAYLNGIMLRHDTTEDVLDGEGRLHLQVQGGRQNSWELGTDTVVL